MGDVQKERVWLVFWTSDFRLELAEGAVVFRCVGTGLLVFYCLTTESMMLRRWVPPAVAKTSKTPWPMDESEASTVPLHDDVGFVGPT